MQLRLSLLAALLILSPTLCPAGQAASERANVVAFYTSYLEMVRAPDFVRLSRDDKGAWEAKCDAAARKAGFEDAAAARAAGENMADDPEVAALRQSVDDTIARQYRPYRD